MSHQEMTVFIVDDDKAVRASLTDLMVSIGIEVQSYSNASNFLSDYSNEFLGCLVLDIRMPGMSGLELQQELNERKSILPVILITGHGDIAMAVRAIQEGALDFLQKPFRNQNILELINRAFLLCVKQKKKQQQTRLVTEQINSLTSRELQVMRMILTGKTNKVIALDLSLSQRTIEVHRANILKKLEVKSAANLVRVLTLTNLI